MSGRSTRPVLPIARAVPAMGHLHGLLMIVKHKELVYSWCEQLTWSTM
jgi:hypothetical protein